MLAQTESNHNAKSGASSPLSSAPSSIEPISADLRTSPTTRQLAALESVQISPQTPAKVGRMKTRSSAHTVKTVPKDMIDTASSEKPRGVVKSLKKAVGGLKKSQKSKWTAPFVYSSEKSPLATTDLRKILLNPLAWDILSLEDKQEILALFPDSVPIIEAGTPNARPDIEALRNDDNFRYDCARYTESLAAGRHDLEWLHEAWVARERRKAGDYDEYLARKFEDDWGISLPPQLRPERGSKPLPNLPITSDERGLDAQGETARQNPPSPTEPQDEVAATLITAAPTAEMANQEAPAQAAPVLSPAGKSSLASPELD